MPQRTILKKLTFEYDSFTKSEKKIADYVLNNPLKAQYMTISELANEAGVADSTLSSFCRSLGCRGFGEFKLILAQDSSMDPGDSDVIGKIRDGMLHGISQTDTVQEMCEKLLNANQQALTETYRLVEADAVRRAVDIIEEANRVYCYGQGGSSVMAMEAWARFITVTNKVQWVQDSHMQAMTTSLMHEKEAILYFSFSGATRDLIEIAQVAKKNRVRLILITGFQNTPAAEYADVVLQCGVIEGPLQGGSVAAKVAQLFLIDVVANEFCRRNIEKATENRHKAAQSIANQYL